MQGTLQLSSIALRQEIRYEMIKGHEVQTCTDRWQPDTDNCRGGNTLACSFDV
jgi:hypothetical protein